ncbi:MAG: hypothetical protein ABIH34_01595 [Nanoarchaeota archaeon]
MRPTAAITLIFYAGSALLYAGSGAQALGIDPINGPMFPSNRINKPKSCSACKVDPDPISPHKPLKFSASDEQEAAEPEKPPYHEEAGIFGPSLNKEGQEVYTIIPQEGSSLSSIAALLTQFWIEQQLSIGEIILELQHQNGLVGTDRYDTVRGTEQGVIAGEDGLVDKILKGVAIKYIPTTPEDSELIPHNSGGLIVVD